MCGTNCVTEEVWKWENLLYCKAISNKGWYFLWSLLRN